MDWQTITELKGSGWSTVLAMAIGFASLLLGSKSAARKEKKNELQEAEQEVREANATRDVDRQRRAIVRLRNARKAASLPPDGD